LGELLSLINCRAVIEEVKLGIHSRIVSRETSLTSFVLDSPHGGLVFHFK
jgi:hypothetical protein